MSEQPTDDHLFTREFWDARYAGSDWVWSGRPNPRLVEQVAGLEPATALDVGCGEGADVVWLARQGWTVTGVDVSAVALERAARHAEEAGVTDRCTWQQVDLLAGDPLPQADLVSAQFLHLPDGHFATAYAAVAGAVRPGGTLLVAAHHPADVGTGLRNERLADLLFAPDRVTALLDPREWEVQVAAEATREETREDRTATVTDTVVRAVRRA